MRTYTDICVSPFIGPVNAPSVPRGGPHYPDFSNCTWERHLRCNWQQGVAEVSDSAPAVEIASANLPGCWVWAGPAEEHFGHQIVEFSTRMAEAGRAGFTHFLFSEVTPSLVSRIRQKPPQLYERLTALAKWFGGADASIHVIDRATIVAKLVVFPQGEVDYMPPAPFYLPILKEIQNRYKSQIDHTIPGKKYFLTKTNFKARIAGERYLCKLFQKNGWEVVRPEELPLAAQIDIFSNASEVVVTEGSALHTAHLLADIGPRLTILNRRKNYRISAIALESRKADFEYVDCVNGLLSPLQIFFRGTEFCDHLAISLADTDQLLSVLVNRFGLQHASASEFRIEQFNDLMKVVSARRYSRLPLLLRPTSIDRERTAWKAVTNALQEPYRSKVQALI